MGFVAEQVPAIRSSLMAGAEPAATRAGRTLRIGLGLLVVLIMRADATSGQRLFGQRLDGMNVVMAPDLVRCPRPAQLRYNASARPTPLDAKLEP
jgi:hypothetical protein